MSQVEDALKNAEGQHDPEYSACYTLQQLEQKKMAEQLRRRRRRATTGNGQVKRAAATRDVADSVATKKACTGSQ